MKKIEGPKLSPVHPSIRPSAQHAPFGRTWCRAIAGPRREIKIGWCAPAVGIRYVQNNKKTTNLVKKLFLF